MAVRGADVKRIQTLVLVQFEISLRNLSALCVSAVTGLGKEQHRRDAENAEATQRVENYQDSNLTQEIDQSSRNPKEAVELDS